MTTIRTAALPFAPATPVQPTQPKPADFPARMVQVPRDSLRSGINITSLAVGGIGVVGGAAALLRSAGSGGMMRPSMPAMIAFGAAALVGGIGVGVSRIIPPKSEPALAAGMPTSTVAEQVRRQFDVRAKVVECSDGTFAVLRDTSPVYSGGSSGSRGSRSSRPSGGSRPAPDYPSGGSSRRTSPGDSPGSGGSGGSSSSRNSTSNGNPSYDDF